MAKAIVLCCDGTWNTADQADDEGRLCSTNVVKIACRLSTRGADGSPQVIYYDQGVGTGNVLDRMTGGAFGDGLEANIHDAYRFLIANYEPGDRIYLFGFSRGAFTARSIAGMVRKCGILRRSRVRQYPKAKEQYRRNSLPDDADNVTFRKENAIEPNTSVHCVGVWDTVGALGIPLRGFRSLTQREHQFHDTALSRSVKFAFHALAADERRAPFKPALWDNQPVAGQRVEQVWFAGAHSDVGGGYGETGLSDIALEWMLNRATVAGLKLDDQALKDLDTHAALDAEIHNSKKGLYTVTMGLDREIGGTAHGTEYFHRKLVERWQKVKDYRPASLKKHAAKLDALAAGLAASNADVFAVR